MLEQLIKIEEIDKKLQDTGFTVSRVSNELTVSDNGVVITVKVNKKAGVSVDSSGYRYSNPEKVAELVQHAFNKRHNIKRQQAQTQNEMDMILRLVSHFSPDEALSFSDYQSYNNNKINLNKLGFKFQSNMYIFFRNTNIYFSSGNIQIEEMPEIQKALQEIEDYWNIVIL